MRAALEGTAYWLFWNVSLMKQITGVHQQHMISTGGGSHNTLWVTIKSSMLGMDFIIPDIPESAALGAAMVASLAVGAINSIVDAVEINSVHTIVMQSISEMVSAYREITDNYTRFYMDQGLILR